MTLWKRRRHLNYRSPISERAFLGCHLGKDFLPLDYHPGGRWPYLPCSLSSYIQYQGLYISIQPSRQCGSIFSYLFFLSPGFAFLFCPFFFLLENSTDKGSSLTAVLCNGHVRNTCSLLPINSEESSHGLCVNDWKLLYSNKTLFIDLHISF